MSLLATRALPSKTAPVAEFCPTWAAFSLDLVTRSQRRILMHLFNSMRQRKISSSLLMKRLVPWLCAHMRCMAAMGAYPGFLSTSSLVFSVSLTSVPLRMRVPDPYFLTVSCAVQPPRSSTQATFGSARCTKTIAYACGTLMTAAAYQSVRRRS